jgi:hypothetical protein
MTAELHAGVQHAPSQVPIIVLQYARFINFPLDIYMGAAAVKKPILGFLDSHMRDPGSIPCNVTFCPNLEIVTQGHT